MSRLIYCTGNSSFVSIPPDVLRTVGLGPGDEVFVVAEPDQRRIVIAPAEPLPGVSGDLLGRVDCFIERYRPALDALARE